MAMNLRLPEDLAAGLRALSAETGRSQQDLAREALEAYVRQRLDSRLGPWLREHAQPPTGPFVAIPAGDRIRVPAGLDSVALVREQRGGA
ncbi:MAG: ribbon-helix-helix protein, CopG family [Actinomycetota bacterium]|nr:ribbon-helix-helix protein, CopG family [Actinomycetota bacterium]